MKPRQPNRERAGQFDLSVPEHAYAFGLFQTDGHLREDVRNRGSLSLELSAKDADILARIAEILPVSSKIHHRERSTNFTDGQTAQYSSLRVFDWGFRLRLQELGIPVGKKSDVIAPPTVPYSVPDYWRGVIDGDGSLGITPSTGKPFVSLVTASDGLADAFRTLLHEVTGRRYLAGRNQRDNAYNIMTTGEYAQTLAAYLYYDGCLAMDRKACLARGVAEWRPRPARPRKDMRRWTAEEDSVLLAEGAEAAAAFTGRSVGAAWARLSYIQPKRNGHTTARSWSADEDSSLFALGVAGFLASGSLRTEKAAAARLHRLRTGRA